MNRETPAEAERDLEKPAQKFLLKKMQSLCFLETLKAMMIVDKHFPCERFSLWRTMP